MYESKECRRIRYCAYVASSQTSWKTREASKAIYSSTNRMLLVLETFMCMTHDFISIYLYIYTLMHMTIYLETELKLAMNSAKSEYEQSFINQFAQNNNSKIYKYISSISLLQFTSTLVHVMLIKLNFLIFTSIQFIVLLLHTYLSFLI